MHCIKEPTIRFISLYTYKKTKQVGVMLVRRQCTVLKNRQEVLFALLIWIMHAIIPNNPI